MATKTWQNGGVDNNWSTAGNWAEGSKPAAGDDVVMAVNYNCVLNENTATLKSFDMTGYAGTFSGSSAITVNGATGATTTVYLAAGTWSHTGAININPQGTGIINFSATVTLPSVTIGSATTTGTVELQTDLTVTGYLTVSRGTFDSNGYDLSISRFSSIGTATRTVTLGDTVMTLSYSSGTLTNMAFTTSGTGLTFNYNTSEIKFTGGSASVSAINTFYKLTKTGTAAYGDGLYFATDITVTNAFDADGNSTAYRTLVASNVVGTPRTLTVTGATISGCSNVDFRDITFANGGSNVDFSTITGGSGDCGGNTISGGGTLTFTTADDWYWHVDAGNWSDNTKWYDTTNGAGNRMDSLLSGTRGPLPQDTFYIDTNSFDSDGPDITIDMSRLGGINATGQTNTGCLLSDGHSTELYGSVIESSGTKFSSTGSSAFDFMGRGSYVIQQQSSWSDTFTINAPNGTYTLAGNLTLINNRNFNFEYGTFDSDTYDVSIAVTFNSNYTNTRTLLMGSGTWTIPGAWTMNSTNLTNPTTMGETSTITWGTATSNTDYTFTGGGCTYNNLSIVGSTTGTQIMTIAGSNTFNIFTIGATKTVKFTAGTTQTVSSFVATGDATHAITITSATAAVHYLKDTTGTNTVSYCTISYSYVYGSGDGGGALFDASDGTNTDGGNNQAYNAATNEGWKFSSAPSENRLITKLMISIDTKVSIPLNTKVVWN